MKNIRATIRACWLYFNAKREKNREKNKEKYNMSIKKIQSKIIIFENNN